MKKRKIAALAILLIGTAAALAINSKAGNSQNSIVQEGQDNFNTNALDYNKALAADSAISENLQNINVTKTIANAYLEEFFKKNQDLIGNPQGLTEEININLDDLTVPEIVEKNALSFKPFEKGVFPLTANVSPAAQLAYLEEIGKAGEKNFSGIKKNITQLIDQWLDKKDPDGLNLYLQGAEQQIKDLQKIAVPANWEQFHLQNLNLWQKKVVVYGAILQSEDDPLKAYIAIQMISDIAEENDSLQKIISEKYSELDKNR